MSGDRGAEDNSPEPVPSKQRRRTMELKYLQSSIRRKNERICALEEALRECCRMFAWCDAQYGKLWQRPCFALDRARAALKEDGDV